MVDANKLLARQEVDKECDAEYLAAAEHILCMGCEETDDGDVLSSTDAFPLDEADTDTIDILVDGVRKATNVAVTWSMVRLTEESDSMCEIVRGLTLNLVVYDAVRMHNLFTALAGPWRLWDAALVKATADAWPCLDQERCAIAGTLEEESKIEELCKSSEMFVVSLQKAASVSTDLHAAAQALLEEVKRSRHNEGFRTMVWDEAVALSQALQPQPPGFTATMLMQQWVTKGKGPFVSLSALASGRPTAIEYLAPVAISDYSVVKFTGVESGLAPLAADSGFNDFVLSWKHAVGLTHLLDTFYYGQVSSMLNSFMDEVSKVLNGVQVREGAKVVQASPSPSAMAALTVAAAGLDIKSVVMLAGAVDTTNGDIGAFVESLPFVQVAERLSQVLDAMDVVTQPGITWDSKPLPAGEVKHVVNAYKHLASALVVAAVVSDALDRSSDANLVTKEKSKSGAMCLSVAAFHQAAVGWVHQNVGVNWAVMHPGLDELAGTFKFSISMCDAVVVHLSSEWVPLAQTCLIGEVTAVLQNEAEALKAATPSWSHIVKPSVYNHTMAKKQLLSGLEKVAGMIETVDFLARSITEASDAWGLSLAENVPMNMAEGVLDAARLAMTVCASVNVLEKYSAHPSGPKMAEDLLSEKGLPESLRSHLKKVAAKAA